MGSLTIASYRKTQEGRIPSLAHSFMLPCIFSPSYTLHGMCSFLELSIPTVGMKTYYRVSYPNKSFIMSSSLTPPAATAAIPLSLHVVMLGVVMFLMGLTFGGLNNSKCCSGYIPMEVRVYISPSLPQVYMLFS